MRSLLQEYSHPDVELSNDTLHGFPVVGKLPPCLLEADVMPKPRVVKSLEEFAAERETCNKKILATLRESEHSSDLMDIYEKDRELGALGGLCFERRPGAVSASVQEDRSERAQSERLAHEGRG